MDTLKGWQGAQHSLDRIFGDHESRGSNNWVIGPQMSADGHAIVSSDPHLSLSAPSVFWMVPSRWQIATSSPCLRVP